jgi:hypothetical protein
VRNTKVEIEKLNQAKDAIQNEAQLVLSNEREESKRTLEGMRNKLEREIEVLQNQLKATKETSSKGSESLKAEVATLKKDLSEALESIEIDRVDFKTREEAVLSSNKAL